ncbi:MAG: DUF4142 domain-containing protein [Thermodesulfobacteriota bacterium]
MMSTSILATVAAMAALIAAPAAYADDHAQHAPGSATIKDVGKPGNKAVPDNPPGKSVMIDDQAFIPKALEGSMAEVELADLALEKSKNDSVKNFAQQMKKDHSASQSVLANAATQEGIEQPKQLSAKHQKIKDELSKLQGEEFDREYMSHMVKDHEQELAMYSAKARTGDGDVSSLAQRMVPVLDRHLNMARSVSQGITTGQELEEQRQGKAPRPAHGPAEQ